MATHWTRTASEQISTLTDKRLAGVATRRVVLSRSAADNLNVGENLPVAGVAGLTDATPGVVTSIIQGGYPTGGVVVIRASLAGGDDIVLRTTGPTDVTLPTSGTLGAGGGAVELTYYTNYTGAGGLDQEVTIGKSGNLRLVIVSSSLSFWQLITGTSTTNVAGGIIRPADYDSSTNKKQWVRILGL